MGAWANAAILCAVLQACSSTVQAQQDHYRILGVSRRAGEQEIKKAYRKMAMEWHPDKNPGNEEQAESMFARIAEAHEVLSDPIKKRTYDLTGFSDQRQQQQYHQQQQRQRSQNFGGFGRGYQQYQPPPRQPPIESATMQITSDNFDELRTLNCNSIWVIQFYYDASQPCRNFAPHWEASAKQLSVYAQFGRVDALKDGPLSKRWGIGVNAPSLIIFADGKRIGTMAESPRVTEDVIRFVIKNYPAEIERIPAKGSSVPITRASVDAWIYGSEAKPLSQRAANTPTVLLLRELSANFQMKAADRLALRFVARRFRKQLRFLVIDISGSQCRAAGRVKEQHRQCVNEIDALKQQWAQCRSTCVVREAGHPLAPLGTGDKLPGGKDLKRLLMKEVLLSVAELTSRTVEYACPHEIQRRTSQPMAHCILLLGSRGGVSTPSFPLGAGSNPVDADGEALLRHLAVVQEVAASKNRPLEAGDTPWRFVRTAVLFTNGSGIHVRYLSGLLTSLVNV